MSDELDLRPEPNAPLAWKVLEHIETHPELHYQQNWLTQGACGTRGCFAGWASMLSGDTPLTKWESFTIRYGYPPDEDLKDKTDPYWQSIDTLVVTETGEVCGVRERAIELLGLGEWAADDLFNGSNSREYLRELVVEIFGQR